MIRIRTSGERGHADHGWLNTYHTFSFADYYDPSNTSFRSLRVINEDWIAGGRGFGTHPHRDMEIITYMLEGALEHGDSMGNGGVIVPGEVQRMSAGTGIAHSERNASPDETAHLLQIWIMPEQLAIEPTYEQKEFPAAEKRGTLRLIASSDGRDGAVTINQDVDLYATLLEPGESVEHMVKTGRHAWVQVARGAIDLNGHQLRHGDGAAITNEDRLTLAATESAEVLLFDLA
ncbi:MAG: redox-sensitive bicupin YhaK, pirin superfamily [Chlorobi bacterium]|nr:redox-sensitive bicupin YhaK, pirin superfamily [Chlorobiota bacterium]